MLISDQGTTDKRYVWTWLAGETAPVVAGVLVADGYVGYGLRGSNTAKHAFYYGRSYLSNSAAVPLSIPDLPLKNGPLWPYRRHGLHGIFRDALSQRGTLTGEYRSQDFESPQLFDFANSYPDRIGAIDFHLSPTEYINNEQPPQKDLATLVRSARAGGMPFSTTGVGGAQPKFLYDTDDRKLIVKLSNKNLMSQYDVRLEYFGIKLAKSCGIECSRIDLKKVDHQPTLLVERFDREQTDNGWLRHHMVSAQTALGLHDDNLLKASYESLAELLGKRAREPKRQLRELFRRMVFNVLIGNTDDHAKNHSLFCIGEEVKLTPAYDMAPQINPTSVQSMRIAGRDPRSTLKNCLLAAESFQLAQIEAQNVITELKERVLNHIPRIAEKANLTSHEQGLIQKLVQQRCRTGD